jgi:hypothetical protein
MLLHHRVYRSEVYHKEFKLFLKHVTLKRMLTPITQHVYEVGHKVALQLEEIVPQLLYRLVAPMQYDMPNDRAHTRVLTAQQA